MEGSCCIDFPLSLLMKTASLLENFIGDCLLDPDGLRRWEGDSLPEDFSGDRLLDPLPDALNRWEGDSEANVKVDPPCSNP